MTLEFCNIKEEQLLDHDEENVNGNEDIFI